MNAEELMDKARIATGMEEWGQGPSVDFWLNLLVDDINRLPKDAHRIHGERWAQRLLWALESRLVLHEAAPVPQRPEKQPIIILGPPRSGTTYLHELLAHHAGIRVPRLWEGRHPLANHLGPEVRKAAIDESQAFCEMLDVFVPELKKIHPQRWCGPEEIRMLIEPGFQTAALTVQFWIPNYARAIECSDMTEAWRLMLRVMSVLPNLNGDRWVLKDPSHLFAVKELIEVVQPIIVRLYRDPTETIPSLCSLISVSQKATTGYVDPHIGWNVLSKYVSDARAAQRAINEYPNVLHVHYKNLMDHPISVVDRIVSHAGDAFCGDSVLRYVEENPKDKYGKHHYGAEDYGLTRELIHNVMQGV